ncbi:aromatic-ring-hydroxylating dioxygenase subunit beta [Jatrophihabitans fulvus]
MQTAMLDHATAAALVHLEARLLDENRLHEWLDLLTDDVVYWVPLVPGSDPRRDLSICRDDRFALEARVWRILESGVNHSQDPPSRTVRAVSNVEVFPDEEGGPAVRFVTTLYEVRPGGQRSPDPLRVYPMRCDYRVRQESGSWLISHRTLTILQADMDLAPLTFLL